jgi:hypothetical protein
LTRGISNDRIGCGGLGGFSAGAPHATTTTSTKPIRIARGYVHIAARHRSIPPELVAAGMKEIDPTDRLLKMLAARAKFLPKTADSETVSGTNTAS